MKNNSMYLFILIAILFASPLMAADNHIVTVTMTSINTVTIVGAVGITLPATPGAAWSTTDNTSTIAYQHNKAADQKIQVASAHNVAANWNNVFLRVSSAAMGGGSATTVTLSAGAGADVAATDFLNTIPAGDYAAQALVYDAYHTWGADDSAKTCTVTYTVADQ